MRAHPHPGASHPSGRKQALHPSRGQQASARPRAHGPRSRPAGAARTCRGAARSRLVEQLRVAHVLALEQPVADRIDRLRMYPTVPLEVSPDSRVEPGPNMAGASTAGIRSHGSSTVMSGSASDTTGARARARRRGTGIQRGWCYRRDMSEQSRNPVTKPSADMRARRAMLELAMWTRMNFGATSECRQSGGSRSARASA